MAGLGMSQTPISPVPEPQSAWNEDPKHKSYLPSEADHPCLLRKSSTASHADVHVDGETTNRFLKATSFLEGVGGSPCPSEPLASKPPGRPAWQVLWLLMFVLGLYHVVRLVVMLICVPYAITEQVDFQLAAGTMMCLHAHSLIAIPVAIFKWSYISRLRAFSAAFTSMLTKENAELLLTDLGKAVCIFQMRHVLMFVANGGVEAFLLFGPGHNEYRVLALWPMPQDGFFSVVQVVLQGCFYFFLMVFPDIFEVFLLSVDHFAKQMKMRLENAPVIEASREYECFCDFMDDAFRTSGNHLNMPFSVFSIEVVCIIGVFIKHPDTPLMPYIALQGAIAIFQFGINLHMVAKANQTMSDLANSVSARALPHHGVLDTAASLNELHFKQRVASRRPAFMIFGFLVLTYENLFMVGSFLLSIIFVIGTEG